MADAPYKVKKIGDVHVLTLGGHSAEQPEADAFDLACQALTDKYKARKVVIDFANLPHVSSALLGAILSLYWRLQEQDGALRVCNVSPAVQEVLKITRLHKRIDMDAEVAQSVAALE